MAQQVLTMESGPLGLLKLLHCHLQGFPQHFRGDARSIIHFWILMLFCLVFMVLANVRWWIIAKISPGLIPVPSLPVLSTSLTSFLPLSLVACQSRHWIGTVDLSHLSPLKDPLVGVEDETSKD